VKKLVNEKTKLYLESVDYEHKLPNQNESRYMLYSEDRHIEIECVTFITKGPFSYGITLNNSLNLNIRLSNEKYEIISKNTNKPLTEFQLNGDGSIFRTY
jgi:hypothetical protein